jgi:hypothetical protein
MKYIKAYEITRIPTENIEKYKDDSIKKYAIIKPLNKNLEDLYIIVEVPYQFKKTSTVSLIKKSIVEKYTVIKRLFNYNINTSKIEEYHKYEQSEEEILLETFYIMMKFESNSLIECKEQIQTIATQSKYNL